MEEPRYVLVQEEHGTLRFYNETVWKHKQFRKSIKGQKIGDNLSLQEVVAMKKLMESAHDSEQRNVG